MGGREVYGRAEEKLQEILDLQQFYFEAEISGIPGMPDAVFTNTSMRITAAFRSPTC
jgi:G:T-mismatch repair DNA endonuclease (very short patch repair protein)